MGNDNPFTAPTTSIDPFTTPDSSAAIKPPIASFLTWSLVVVASVTGILAAFLAIMCVVVESNAGGHLVIIQFLSHRYLAGKVTIQILAVLGACLCFDAARRFRRGRSSAGAVELFVGTAMTFGGYALFFWSGLAR